MEYEGQVRSGILEYARVSDNDGLVKGNGGRQAIIRS